MLDTEIEFYLAFRLGGTNHITMNTPVRVSFTSTGSLFSIESLGLSIFCSLNPSRKTTVVFPLIVKFTKAIKSFDRMKVS